MFSILQSMALYGDDKWNELMLMLLYKAFVVGSMVATFAHHIDGTAPLLKVSTLLETGQCLA